MTTRFGPFTLDLATRTLRRGRVEVHLHRKAFELLAILLAHRPAVVNKDELQATLWPDSHVDAAGLNVLVSDVRRALDDDAKRPAYIRTVHGVGYAFCADAVHDAATASRGAAACWLEWGDQRFRLNDGENVIGRDPRCAVWVDAVGVSRRHAAVDVDGPSGVAQLRDLASTNGTFVGSVRVHTPRPIGDDEEVTVGSVTLKFRRWLPERAPETRRIRRR